MAKETNTQTITEYQEMTSDDLKKLSPGQFFGDALVIYPNPEDETQQLTSNFAVYDGIAYSVVEVDGAKREIVATFPMVKFVNTVAKNMKTKVLNALGITVERDVTCAELLQLYGNFSFVGD